MCSPDGQTRGSAPTQILKYFSSRLLERFRQSTNPECQEILRFLPEPVHQQAQR